MNKEYSNIKPLIEIEEEDNKKLGVEKVSFVLRGKESPAGDYVLRHFTAANRGDYDNFNAAVRVASMQVSTFDDEGR